MARYFGLESGVHYVRRRPHCCVYKRKRVIVIREQASEVIIGEARRFRMLRVGKDFLALLKEIRSEAGEHFIGRGRVVQAGAAMTVDGSS